MKSPTLGVDDHPDATVVHVRADLDGRLAETLRAALTCAVDRRGHVVLDLADAATVDSTGLGLLVRVRQQARRRHATVCIVAPSRFVVTVLHTMRLDRAFPIFDDCPSALAWLARQSAAPGP
jgi:anti-anti-sigma factor